MMRKKKKSDRYAKALIYLYTKVVFIHIQSQERDEKIAIVNVVMKESAGLPWWHSG